MEQPASSNRHHFSKTPRTAAGYNKKTQYKLVDPKNVKYSCCDEEETSYPGVPKKVLKEEWPPKSMPNISGVGHFGGDLGDLPPRFAKIVKERALDLVLNEFPEELLEKLKSCAVSASSKTQNLKYGIVSPSLTKYQSEETSCSKTNDLNYPCTNVQPLNIQHAESSTFPQTTSSWENPKVLQNKIGKNNFGNQNEHLSVPECSKNLDNMSRAETSPYNKNIPYTETSKCFPASEDVLNIHKKSVALQRQNSDPAIVACNSLVIPKVPKSQRPKSFHPFKSNTCLKNGTSNREFEQNNEPLIEASPFKNNELSTHKQSGNSDQKLLNDRSDVHSSSSHFHPWKKIQNVPGISKCPSKQLLTVRDQALVNVLEVIETQQKKSLELLNMNRIKVLIQNGFDNEEYWKKFFMSHLKTDFKIGVQCCDTHSFELLFPDIALAKEARALLNKAKKYSEFSYSVTSAKSTVKSNPKPSNNMLNIRDSAIEEIFDHLENRMIMHRRKISIVDDELTTKKSRSARAQSEDELLAVTARKQSLIEMGNVFKNFCNNRIFDLKKTFSSIKDLTDEIKSVKKDILRECFLFETNLPIYSKKEDIMDIVKKNQVSILVADTGSGKSTQFVQYLLQGGYDSNGIIVCTQPRKVAAINLCHYVSGQLASPMGDVVGFETGLRKNLKSTTKIVYMTDFALLKRCINDKTFKGISCIVVDEAHERTLHTDLILGMIKKCLQKRKDLRVIITSATIDPHNFMNFFNLNSDSLLRIPGRNYPVNVIWQNEDACIGWNYMEAAVKQAHKIHCTSAAGDILVFLTSPGETEEASKLFQNYTKGSEKTHYTPDIHCLHGRQETTEQLQAFKPVAKDHRKIIFATNSAETSITIHGIKYIVDSGMVKELQYDKQTKRNSLIVTFINRSSADQRKGRAGRTGPGTCYRMYSERNFYRDMKESSIPEILQVSLQQAALKIIELGIQPMKFDYINSPDTESLEEAIDSLDCIGAIEQRDQGISITELGKKLGRFPLEPHLAKLVIRGIESGIGYECMVLAALCSISGRVFFRTDENRSEADRQKVQYCDPAGDFCTFLVVFYNWQRNKDRLSKIQWCADNFINSKSMRVSNQIVNELCEIAWNELKLPFAKGFQAIGVFRNKSESVLLECFSENLCIFSGHERTGYVSPFLEGSFFIHPSSCLYSLGEKTPQFIIYSTILKTSRDFLLNVAPIKESTIIEAYHAGKFSIQIDMLKCLQIGPIVMANIGDVLLINHILGRNGCKLQMIERELRRALETDAFHINVSVPTNEVSVLTDTRHRKTVTTFLEKRIEKARYEMAKEDEVCSLLTVTSCQFALGIGGYVHDVILPNEFRELCISVQSKNCNACEIEKLLNDFGTVISFNVNSSEIPQSFNAQFQKVEQAHRALHKLQQNPKLLITAKVISSNENKSHPLYRIGVTWRRASCKGHGWVHFSNDMDFQEASALLTSKPMYLGEKVILFSPAAEAKTLYMNHLPPNAEEREVREAIKEHLPRHIQVKSVILACEKIYSANQKDVEIAKSRISRMFIPFSASNNMLIDVTFPLSSDTNWKATICFMVASEGEKAFNALGRMATIGNSTFNLTPILESVVHCKIAIYRTIEKDLFNFKQKCLQTQLCKCFTICRNSSGFVDITFSCPNIENLRKVHQTILQLTGRLLLSNMKSPELAPAFSKTSVVSFRDIEKMTKTSIYVDNIQKTISIYGAANAQRRAAHEIKVSVQNAKFRCTRVLNLSEKTVPSGFLKTLYKRFGYDLEGLTKQFTELKSASINILRHELILEGYAKGVSKVEDHLRDICVELHKSSKEEKTPSAKNQNKETCPVCFDIITSESVTLENCGHAVCLSCLELQLQSKVIPVVCVYKDCQKPFFYADLNKAFSGHDDLKTQFCDAALKYFVQCNLSTFMFCPTPDCGMVHRLSTKESQQRCVSCQNDICISCHTLYHHGMTCDMYQNSKVDKDYPLKVWQEKDLKNRKNCPSCSIAIEKDGGCEHVVCENCQKHLCWLCLKAFKTSEDVYDHIQTCPFNNK